GNAHEVGRLVAPVAMHRRIGAKLATEQIIGHGRLRSRDIDPVETLHGLNMIHAPDEGKAPPANQAAARFLVSSTMRSAVRPTSSCRWSNSVRKVPTPWVTERISTIMSAISASGISAETSSQPFQPSRAS